MSDEREETANGFKVGNVSGVGIAVGHHSSAQVINTSPEGLQALFAPVYEAIDARPEDDAVDKDEIRETVKKVEAEASRGDDANEGKLDRWFRFLADMAPDIWEVLTTTVTNPAAGVATVIRKVGEKSRQQSTAPQT